MKATIIVLLSLLSFVSSAQFVPFDLHSEIVSTGRKMVEKHAAAQADTCITKADLKAAKIYSNWQETALNKSQAETALLRLQVEQRGERITAMENEKEDLRNKNADLQNINTGLQTAIVDCQTNHKFTGWVCGGLGVALGLIISLAISN